jgi:hypothetical protein
LLERDNQKTQLQLKIAQTRDTAEK